MAGAGQPWYMPILWPVAHVSSAILKPEKDKVGPNVSLAKLDLLGHLTSFCAALRSFSFAYIAIYWLYEENSYPAFQSGTRILGHFLDLEFNFRSILGRS